MEKKKTKNKKTRFPGNEKTQPEPSAPALRDLRETNFDPAEWGTKVDDRFYNNHAFKEQEPLEKCEPGKEKSQTSMKEVTALNESSEEDKDMEENAALKIQAAFRGHLAREEVKKMKSSDLQEKTEENE
ncbi:sperm surface protein Sp17 isoform X2 [Physeter macrocephalus]|uniref:Sperm surface protein Sp17 isoform X2 n=1 Tax=Physeter macrocephalus TaxID=9755 RepID=A0A2Y9TFY8_PHYMC|nr:sperm surface protein Sp17 isoform X2 [Physeter catodon]|eukprot:XP_023987099.1 sperm surface protein Sp17 isoform X2 [Physeter catodon]